MASNTDITTGSGEDASLIQLTLSSPSEGNTGPGATALLTARGKDHEMNADQLVQLGLVCLRYAGKLRKRK